ncbi:MAG: AAA family ATPase [Acidobacteriota bacterium]|nr:AAA family ATPase [Acidobacteriota bacterium]
MNIPGYLIEEELYRSANTLVLRCVRELDGEAVVLKTLADPYAPPEAVSRLKREINLTRSLDIKNVIKVQADAHRGNLPAMVMEDIGGKDLSGEQYRHPHLSLDLFFEIALKLVEALAGVHRKGIIHKDINPRNIVYHPDRHQLRLIDFGIASALDVERGVSNDAGTMEGTLPYIAPEQTGRMNRGVDYRSDYYALGITFFELLTGKRPFTADNATGWVYQHVTQLAPDARAFNGTLPLPLAQIVARLLEKEPEARYQSTRGLIKDLLQCREHWSAGKAIPAFPIARQDISEKFRISEHVRGREREVTLLQDRLSAVAVGGTELALVTGYSGVGKTTLVGELTAAITQRRGIFGSGKFEQVHRDTAYSALGEAINQLAGRLLALNPEELSAWQARLKDALGANARLILELAPDFAEILDEPEVLPELPPSQAQNRFRATFEIFFKVFAAAEHPLVLFLDDLQWSDQGTLSLLAEIMGAASCPYLMIIGAYRDNEVHQGHPLRVLLDEWDRQKPPCLIPLAPLDSEQVTQLIAATLYQAPSRTLPLGELVHRKTGGNPFFVNALLRKMHEEGLISFDTEAHAWVWDMERIKRFEVSDNVVELMIEKIESLPSATRALLVQAACIGKVFSADLLATIGDLPVARIADNLWSALQEGLIEPMDMAYKWLGEVEEADGAATRVDFCFVHDRIQQAAYALIQSPQKENLHLKIGRLLLNTEADVPDRSRLFPILGHLNIGSKLIEKPAERLQLAELNLVAAQTAHASVAFQSANHHTRKGIALLPQRAWQVHYPLSFALHRMLADTAWSLGGYEEADAAFEILLANAGSDLEKAEVLAIEINRLVAANDFSGIFDIGKTLLGYLGMTVPKRPTREEIRQKQDLVARLLASPETETIADRSLIRDKRLVLMTQTCNRLYENLVHHTHKSNSLGFLLILKAMALILKEGPTEHASFTFSLYGAYLIRIGDVSAAEKVARLTIRLAEQCPNPIVKCYTFAYTAASLLHRFEDQLAVNTYYWKSFRIAMENGEYFVGFGASQSIVDHAYDLTLAEMVAESEKLAVAQRDSIPYAVFLPRVHRLFRRNLMGLTPQRFSLEEGHEELYSQLSTQMPAVQLHYYNYMIQLLYLYGDCAGAVALHEAAFALKDSQDGWPISFDLIFFAFLSLAGTCRDQPQGDRPRMLRLLRKWLKSAREWADTCPVNYGPQALLMEAELMRVTRRSLEAQGLFEQAVTMVSQSRRMLIQGVVYEAAGRFYLETGLTRLADLYLKDAYYAFHRWGANRKLEQLKERYPRLAGGRKAAPEGTDTNEESTRTELRHLDLATVIKASRALSGEKNLSLLLARIMEISLEHAGAERGFLILRRGEDMIVKVKGAYDGRHNTELISVALPDCPGLSHGIVNYVARSERAVVLKDAPAETIIDDAYLRKGRCKSILSLPLLNQGSLMAVLYMENSKVTGAFSDDHLEVLKLLMTPAALAIENALLKDRETQSAFAYQVGGSLAADAASYVVRRADRVLQDGLREGVLCYVLNPRQMGKSSLRIHTMHKMSTEEETTCAGVDLTMIGGRNPAQWYAGLSRALIRSLGLSSTIDLRAWWQERSFLSPAQILGELIDEEILGKVPGKIILFIDEIDSTQSADFDLDDFFALIRACCEKRAEDPRYQRLAFALFGVAAPSNLIRDKRRAPFNIGRPISLTGFRLGEAKPLLAGLAEKSDDPELILKAVLSWTAGQPFLTQKVCDYLRHTETRPQAGRELAWVTGIIRRRVIDHWEAQDEPEHFKTIRSRLRHQSQSRALLKLYGDVLEGGQNVDGSALQSELCLTGLVAEKHGRLRVSNRIYAEIFDRAWLDRELATPGACGRSLTQHGET